MEKRSIHIDLQGTLLRRGLSDGRYTDLSTKNGPLIVSFAKAASREGHSIKTVTWSIENKDESLHKIYGDTAELLEGALDKGTLHNETRAKRKNGNLDAKEHDILIDDDPQGSMNVHINPNSDTLSDDLENLARAELGFEWQPPKIDA